MKGNAAIRLAASLAFSTAMIGAPAYAGTPSWSTDDVKGSIVFYTGRTDMIKQGHYDRWVAEFKAKYPGADSIGIVGLTDYIGQLQPRMQTEDYGDVVFILSSIPRDQYPHFFYAFR